jgi:DNA invertase Pin-like site-specific DNA recombinase
MDNSNVMEKEFGDNIRTAAIYARSAVKNEAAIATQVAEARAAAEGMGLVIPDWLVFVDNGASGAMVDRPGFDDMMAHVENGDFRHLFVRDLSRLSRDVVTCFKIVEVIVTKNVEIHSVERIDIDPWLVLKQENVSNNNAN